MAEAIAKDEVVVPQASAGAVPETPPANVVPRPLQLAADGQPLWHAAVRKGRARFGAGVLAILAAIPIGLLTHAQLLVALAFALATGCFLLALGYGVLALVRIARADEPIAKGQIVWAAVFPMMAGGTMAFLGAIATLASTWNFGRGRQLRRFGKILLPPLADGEAWARLAPALEIEPELGVALAARWRWNGQTEHASVAAFARLTLDLIALGAPPALITSANLDARDEIRHAELCFALARAFDGESVGPGPFPQVQTARTLPGNRTLALARLAVDSLIDGALHEGLSARVVARLAKRTEVPAIRALLREIAADEGRHSANGWEVVEWCLAEGGEPVAQALRGAIAVLPEGIDSELPAAAVEGGWERFGIQGAALENEEHGRARTELIRRVWAMTRIGQSRAA